MSRTIALRLAALQKRRKADAAKAMALRREEKHYRSIIEQMSKPEWKTGARWLG